MGGRVGEVARLFLRFGFTGFGVPLAHVALMEDECVRVRGWVTREEFADLLSAANVLPGPSSTELAMMLGHRRAGWVGLVLAGMIVVGSFGALLQGVHELIVRVLASAIAMGVREGASVRERAALVGVAGLSAPAGAMMVSGATVGGVFASFLKLGCVVFGSGYVLLAFMRAEFVQRHGWLTEAQLLDALAIGQVTPGPVFSTATFVGYLLAGHAGAATATVGMFLPAFMFAATAVLLLSRGVVATPYGPVVAVIGGRGEFGNREVVGIR